MNGSEATVSRRAIRGAFLLTVSTYISLVVGIAARKWLAILLSPLEFGYALAALSAVNVIFSFASFSFSSAIINVRENLIKEPLEYLHENVFLLTFSLGALLSIVAIVLGALFPPQAG